MSVFELARQIRTVQIADRYTRLKKRGKYLSGLCPVHKEKYPSFVIYPDSGVWTCYACGISGNDAVSLLAAIKNIKQSEAAKLIIQDFGLNAEFKVLKKYNYVENEAPYNYTQLFAIDLYKAVNERLKQYKKPEQQDEKFYKLLEIRQMLDMLSEFGGVKHGVE
jgi:DNA primase